MAEEDIIVTIIFSANYEILWFQQRPRKKVNVFCRFLLPVLFSTLMSCLLISYFGILKVLFFVYNFDWNNLTIESPLSSGNVPITLHRLRCGVELLRWWLILWIKNSRERCSPVASPIRLAISLMKRKPSWHIGRKCDFLSQ